MTTEPSYDFISNASCILTPETSNGPYWLPASEVFRQDIREEEVGVPLELEIGVIDVNTCEVMEGVLVSVWVCLSYSLPVFLVWIGEFCDVWGCMLMMGCDF